MVGMGIRVGIQLAGLRLPFRKALTVASELGADSVEICARTELNPQQVDSTGLHRFANGWMI